MKKQWQMENKKSIQKYMVYFGKKLAMKVK